MIAKYEFMTERMGISLENLFRQSDEATAECVLYDDVQQSLRSKGLEEVSRIGLSKYFAYVGLEHIADYCYVDNKGNVYSRSYSDVTYQDVEESGFRRYLGDEYSRTSGSGQRILCLGRMIMLFLSEDT